MANIEPTTIVAILFGTGGSGYGLFKYLETLANNRAKAKADRETHAADVLKAAQESEPKRIETIGAAWEAHYKRLTDEIFRFRDEVSGLRAEMSQLRTRIVTLESELHTTRENLLTAQYERNVLKNSVQLASYAAERGAARYQQLARYWNVLVAAHRAACEEIQRAGGDVAKAAPLITDANGMAVPLDPIPLPAVVVDPLAVGGTL